jgi:peptidyl-prolyl cis-trans isomerase C
MKFKGFIVWTFVVAVGLPLSGCPSKRDSNDSTAKKGTTPKDSAPKGDLVAKVGDASISLNDFEAQLNQQNPLIRARYKSLEQKKKLLENLVQREAMVQEAIRLGLDKDPEMVRGYKKILARHLVNVEFNKKLVKEIEINVPSIQAYYDENHDRYHAPEKVRVHQIFTAGLKTDAASRSKAKKVAANLLAQLKAKPNDRRLFLELARKHSDDEASKKIGGDTNFKTQAKLVESYGQVFADAAFALKKANDLSGVIETEKGFYVLRQSGRQSAIDLPLDKVRGQIKTTLFAKARGEAYKGFINDIKGRVGVQIFEESVAKAKVDTSDAPDMRKPFPGAHPGMKRPGGSHPGMKKPSMPGAGPHSFGPGHGKRPRPKIDLSKLPRGKAHPAGLRPVPVKRPPPGSK